MCASNAVRLKASKTKIEVDRPGAVNQSSDIRGDLLVKTWLQPKSSPPKVGWNSSYLSSSFKRKIMVHRAFSHGVNYPKSCIEW